MRKTINGDFWIYANFGYVQGLDALEKLVTKWKENTSSYSPVEMRACLDTFREVLFHHLDEEVGISKTITFECYQLSLC